MSKETEQERTLKVERGQKVVRVEIVDNGHGIRYYTISKSKVQLQAGSEEFERMFPIVDIESVSLQDSFMQYEPENEVEERVKSNIIKAKELEMKNFRKPCMDPSFADDGETIIYCAGKKPAVGKEPDWWEENAPYFMPEKNSRLINDLEKDAFLGIIIKYFVEEKKYKEKDAWRTVCVDSTKIGHFYDPDEESSTRNFEMTGSRKVGKWYDLGNTYKIVRMYISPQHFWKYGGDYLSYGDICPVADICNICSYQTYHDSVGELALDV